MKKVVVVVWISIIAFVTAACQAQPSDSESYEKYEALIEAIEEGDVQLAQEELEKFFDVKDSKDDVASETESESEPKKEQVSENVTDVEDEAELQEEEESVQVTKLKEAVASEWLPSKDSKCEELGVVVIREDGSCTIGEDVLQWEVSSAKETGGYIQVLYEGKRFYEMNIYYDAEGYYTMWIYKYSADETEKDYVGGVFYRASDLQKTVITLDNWEEYFVFDTEITISENEFGEPDDVFINDYLKLNPDKIPKVIDQISDVAYEYKYLDGWAKVNFDVETQEYTAEFHEGAHDDTCMNEMYLFEDEEEYYYGGIIESCWITELPYNENAFWEEYKEMLRIQGVIYSVK